MLDTIPRELFYHNRKRVFLCGVVVFSFSVVAGGAAVGAGLVVDDDDEDNDGGDGGDGDGDRDGCPDDGTPSASGRFLGDTEGELTVALTLSLTLSYNPNPSPEHP